MRYLFLRDLKLATRSGGGFGLGLAFFLIVIVLTPLAIGPNPQTLSMIGPGVLWLGALLACLLSMDRVFGLDYEDGALDILATSPMPLEGVYLAKAVAHWLTTGLPLAIAAPLLSGLLNVDSYGWFVLFVSLLIGTPALSLIGAFGAALTVGVKRGGLLLSLLVLPLYIPTLIFGAEAARRAMDGLSFEIPLILLTALSLAAAAILPFASAAALRVNLR